MMLFKIRGSSRSNQKGILGQCGGSKEFLGLKGEYLDIIDDYQGNIMGFIEWGISYFIDQGIVFLVIFMFGVFFIGFKKEVFLM